MNRMMCAAALAALMGRASAEEPVKRAAYYSTNWRVAADGRKTFDGSLVKPESQVAPVKPVGFGAPLPGVLAPDATLVAAVATVPAASPSRVRQASAVTLAAPLLRTDPATLPAALLVPEGKSATPKAWLQTPIARPAGEATPTAVRGPIRAASQDGN